MQNITTNAIIAEFDAYEQDRALACSHVCPFIKQAGETMGYYRYCLAEEDEDGDLVDVWPSDFVRLIA